MTQDDPGAAFRPGEDLGPDEIMALEPPLPSVTAPAEPFGTDLDVLMGYQMILGRDPENSFVITEAKSNRVGPFIRGLLDSGEFQTMVLGPLAAGHKLPHESLSLAPSPAQLDWFFRHVDMAGPDAARLRRATSWRDWLLALTSLPGMPNPVQPLAAIQPPARPASSDEPAEGFILIGLETPRPGDAMPPGAVVKGIGWAIAPADVATIEVLLDGTFLTHARYGLPRPDIARLYPHYRHVDHCGFTFTADIPRRFVPTATSQLTLRVRTLRGEEGEKSLRLVAPETTPAEVIETVSSEAWPIRLDVDEATIDTRRILRLRGWAASMAGLAEVSVSLGETDLGEPRRGLPRLDIARIFRDYPDAGLSGFTLVQKLDASLPAGPGVLRVLAADLGGQTRQSIVPVTIPPPSAAGEADAQAGEALASDECRIHCACDVADLYTDGSLDISGWAFSDAGIGPIEIELNGITIGEVLADRKRPDIAARFPESPLAATSGFTFACAVPPPVKPGFHILSLRLSDRDGQKRVLEQPVPAVAPVARPGKRAAPAMVLQPAIRPEAAGMRLEVDEPSLEGHRARQVVRGALTISGWAVGPRGIETVSVLCDGESLEEAHCGMRREDIGAAFLDYPGSLLAGYALVLPPGSVAPGHHEIEVVARAGGNQPLGASPVTIEKRFSIEVEPPESLPFGSAPRARIPAASIAFGLTLLEDAGFRPAFDIAIGLPDSDGTDLEPLAATLASLSAQAYQDWTAEIFGSRSALSLARALPGSAGAKGRVRFAGKAPAKPLGTARQLRFLLRLRPGDRLGADALLELALHGAANRSADFLYADELRPDPAHGQQQQPFFKPDWSPDLLLAMNYIGRSWCATAELADAAGLTSEALASGSDYDAVLRLTEKAAQIGHVPVVLCARAGIGDAAEDEASALRAALERRGIAASVEAGSLQGTWRVRRMVQATKRAARGFTPGLVSIIIPTCSAGALIRTAIKTLRATSFPQRAGAPRIEIVVLDNTPPEETRARAWLRKNADTVIDMPGPFNWSRFNNIGAASAKGEYFLFLNDDIEATEPDWLEALLEHAQRPEVGVVGARLLYPDGKVQHAGQYLSAGHARHAFRFADAQSAGPFGLATVAREMISVTGACQIMHRRVFKQLGGFEEAHSIVNNDLDFCLRCWQAGLAVIYTPHATLLHHELASRARLDDRYDEALFDTAWRARFLRGDPFRNRHIGLSADEYGAEPEPAELVHAGRTLPQAASLRRILAVKLDHIGDFLTALPALHSLKREFPQARIDLLVPSASAALAAADSALAHGAPIDEVLVFDFFHARSGEGKLPVDETAFEALRARLAPKQYDLAIDLRMHPETRPVLRFTGASFVAGFDHANRFPWLDVALEWEGDARLASKRTHISERLVQLVSAAADACETGAPAAAWTQHAPERVPALAALPARFRSRPLVCIHPGVGNPVRQWPASSYAALIDMLSEQAGVNAVLIGTPDEASIGDEILQRVSAKGAAASLIGKVPLAELPALMQACVLFVGNNSGPQHIAARMGMPALGIHSGVVDAAEWAPLGTRAVAIRRRMVCAPCYLEFASDCPRQLACLTGLLPRDVFSACRRLLVGNVSLAQGGSATGD